MTATNVIALHQEENEPTPDELRTLAMTTVAKIRRSVRRITQRKEKCHSAARVLERAARMMLDAGNPFDQNRIKDRELAAKDLRKHASECRHALKDLGRALIDVAPVIDSVLTLAQRCDILNVNVADRTGLSDEDGIVQLVYLKGLEDSAEHRDQDFKDAPLNNAMTLVFIDFLCNHPEGRKLGDSLFEPGGLFEGVPKYRQLPNGSMERMPPRLRVVGSSESIHQSSITQ